MWPLLNYFGHLFSMATNCPALVASVQASIMIEFSKNKQFSHHLMHCELDHYSNETLVSESAVVFMLCCLGCLQ